MFAEAARVCHKAIKGGWVNKLHSDSWLASLETHIIPAIGSAPVDQVTSVMVRDALAPIWLTIPETARRILQRIGTVLDCAHIEGRSEEHTSELQSLMRISYAVFFLKKKNIILLYNVHQPTITIYP